MGIIPTPLKKVLQRWRRVIGMLGMENGKTPVAELSDEQLCVAECNLDLVLGEMDLPESEARLYVHGLINVMNEVSRRRKSELGARQVKARQDLEYIDFGV